METHADNRSSQISAVTHLSASARCLTISNISTLALVTSPCARNATRAGSSREICPIEFSSSTFLISRACPAAGAGREAGCSFPSHRLSCGRGMLGQRTLGPRAAAEPPDPPAGPCHSSPLQELPHTPKYPRSSAARVDGTPFLDARHQDAISRSYFPGKLQLRKRRQQQRPRSPRCASAGSPHRIHPGVSAKGWRRAGETPQTPARLQGRAEEPGRAGESNPISTLEFLQLRTPAQTTKAVRGGGAPEPPPKQSRPEPLGSSEQPQLRKPPPACSATPRACGCFSDGKHLGHQPRAPASRGKTREAAKVSMAFSSPSLGSAASRLPPATPPAAETRGSPHPPQPGAGTGTDQRALQMPPSLHPSPENRLKDTAEA